MKLFITGMKHCGKSTASLRLATLYGVDRADSDDLILAHLGVESVRDYYREHGKEAFMKAELESTKAYIESHESFVLSLGGGVCDNTALMDELKSCGSIIYLTRDEETIFQRIMLKGLPAFLDAEDPRGSFHTLYERRDAIYRSYADLVIELGEYGDKDETAKMIQQQTEDYLNGR